MPGLLRGIARTAVVAGTASAVGGRVRHRQDQKWAAQEAPPPAARAQPTSSRSISSRSRSLTSVRRRPRTGCEQLKQLGELKAQGVLTEQEFAAEKAKILAG